MKRKIINSLKCAFVLLLCVPFVFMFSACSSSEEPPTKVEITQNDAYSLYRSLVENSDYDKTYLEFLQEYFFSSLDYSVEQVNSAALSVVSVYSYENSSSSSPLQVGSGVVFSMYDSGEAYIITNYHVAYNSAAKSNANYFKVYTYDGYNWVDATFVGWSRTYDIAILKTSASDVLPRYATTISFREQSAILAETCFAIGNTKNAGISITKGIVSMASDSALLTVGGVQSTYHVIRHDAYISSGNSGGGLFDAYGNFIGLTNGGVDNTSINYAIPAEVVRAVANNIIDYCAGNSSVNGKTVNLGISLKSVEAVVNRDDFTSVTLVQQIDNITSGSLASGSGLKTGDTINFVSVDGAQVELTCAEILEEFLTTLRSGDEITINVSRSGSSTSINITLEVTESCLITLI